MANFTRYTTVTLSDEEQDRVLAYGDIRRNGHQVGLLRQTNDEIEFGYENRSGELAVTDDRVDWNALKQLLKRHGGEVLPSDVGSTTVIELPSNPDKLLRALRAL